MPHKSRSRSRSRSRRREKPSFPRDYIVKIKQIQHVDDPEILILQLIEEPPICVKIIEPVSLKYHKKKTDLRIWRCMIRVDKLSCKEDMDNRLNHDPRNIVPKSGKIFYFQPELCF